MCIQASKGWQFTGGINGGNNHNNNDNNNELGIGGELRCLTKWDSVTGEIECTGVCVCVWEGG